MPFQPDLFPVLDKARSLVQYFAVKVRNSLKSAKMRSRTCKLVKRKGRLYVIDKLKPRNKARQG